MKKIVFIVLASTLSLVSYTQKQSGVITYVENLDMDAMIEKTNADMDSASKKYPERAAMMQGYKKKVEEFMKSMEKSKTMLTFKGNETVYKERPAELTEGEIHQEENFMMKMKPQPDIIYYNKSKNQINIQKDFMGKNFLIKDTVQDYKWKLIMERKMIKGYSCMKAIKEDSTYKVEAWFTSQIPISSGPKGLCGLPGMILEAKFIKKELTDKQKKSYMGMMDRYTTDILIKVDNIEYKEVNKNAIESPSKGKVVSSEEEFYKLMFAKVQEMQNAGGKRKGRRGGGFRMRH